MSARTILGVLAVLLAAVVLVSWALSTSRDFGWLHLAGLGLSAAVLAAIFFGRVGGQPTAPPD